MPYGQMSLWGATVITNLMSAIPWVGQDIVEFIWGGFSVNNATLNRFFALHFVLPFVLAALALMHLIALHDSAGSGNPLGVSGNSDRLPFAPYFIFKDLITIFIFILALSIFVFFMPNVLGDSENYVMANPMQTPPAIVPEWYLLPFYAILRSIPNKLLGVIAMFSAILILLTMPFTDLSKTRGIQFRPLSKVAFFIFIGNFLILMQLGAKHVESPFIEFGQISTALYFAHFLLIVPLISVIENSLIELANRRKSDAFATNSFTNTFVVKSGIDSLCSEILGLSQHLHLKIEAQNALLAQISNLMEQLKCQSQVNGYSAFDETATYSFKYGGTADTQLGENSPKARQMGDLARQARSNESKILEMIAKHQELRQNLAGKVNFAEDAWKIVDDQVNARAKYPPINKTMPELPSAQYLFMFPFLSYPKSERCYPFTSVLTLFKYLQKKSANHIRCYGRLYFAYIFTNIASVYAIYGDNNIWKELDFTNLVCDAPRPWGLYFQDSATPQMEGLVELHDNILFYLVIILFGVGWILASIIRSYKSIESPISHKYLSHGTLIELIWTITPALILILIAFPSFKLLYLMDEVSDPAMAILAEGHQWYWSYQYPDFLNSDDEFIEFDSYLVPESDLEDGALRMLEVDNRLIIPELTHVRFIVTGADVIHSFACPALGIKCDAYPGRLNQVSVMINREGTFYGQCSEICGILHSSMPIVIESVSIEKFVAWLLDQ